MHSEGSLDLSGTGSQEPEAESVGFAATFDLSGEGNPNEETG